MPTVVTQMLTVDPRLQWLPDRQIIGNVFGNVQAFLFWAYFGRFLDASDVELLYIVKISRVDSFLDQLRSG